MNGTILQFFHWYYPSGGHLWKEVKEKAETLRQMGITAIWLPPAYKAADGADGVGYAPYDLFDLGEFDQKNTVPTKYGTAQEYVDAVAAAQTAGLVVYTDIVLNHRMGGDEKETVKVVRVDAEDRNTKVGEPFEGEAYTRFTFPGRGKKYSEFIWDFQCFSGIDYLEDMEDDKGIFKILNQYGDDWVADVDGENGNFDYLMGCDVEFRNPNVRSELKYWLKWYWERAHFDGVRIDAVKHISADFFKDLLDGFRAESKPDLFAVGEYWHHDHDVLVSYIEEMEGRMSLFDVPLHDNFHRASHEGAGFDLATILDGTLVQSHPEQAVTLAANHDTQPLQSLEAPVEVWFKPLAYAIILLMEKGYPSVFYPDLFGAHYVDKGNDGEDHEIWMEAVKDLPKLIEARQKYAYGPQQDHLDHPNCIAWVRAGDEEHDGCVVIISNGEAGFKEMTLGDNYKNAELYDFLGNVQDTIHTDEEAKAVFLVNGGSASVWVRKK